nr:hypothetical protein [Tanacetum cinerariifolium]
DCLDCKVSRALSFVLHSHELHILSFILGIHSHRVIWVGEERIPVVTGVVDASLGMGETGENVIIPLRKSRRNAREADPRIPSSLGASLDTTYWMRIVNLQNVDQSFLYGVSDDVDTEYSSKSRNGLDLV